MKTAICCIIKQENLYLRDWIKYHIDIIGINTIILYDNNNLDGEYPNQVIQDYIDKGIVIYIDARGKYRFQLEAYTQCYSKYKEEYDWIGFFDVDEFIELTTVNHNINDFLSQDCYIKTSAIPLYWLIYGDNNLLYYDNKPVYERFKLPNIDYNSNNPKNFKFFIRGRGNNISNLVFKDANDFSYIYYDTFIISDTNGNEITEVVWNKATYGKCYLKHYNTYTITEFLYRRFGRKSYADKASSFNKEAIMNIFWKINEKTPIKEKIAKEYFKKNPIIEDNVNE